MGNLGTTLGLSNSTIEATFLSFGTYNDIPKYRSAVEVSLDGRTHYLSLYLNDNNYKQMRNMLKEGNVYRFTIDSCMYPPAFDERILNISEPHTYTTPLSIIGLHDMKKQYYGSDGFNSHEVYYTCVDGTYKPIHKLGDNDKSYGYGYGELRKTKLIIDDY